jgi:hypothetical protein
VLPERRYPESAPQQQRTQASSGFGNRGQAERTHSCETQVSVMSPGPHEDAAPFIESTFLAGRQPKGTSWSHDLSSF